MLLKSIPYIKTGYFSDLICDYLAETASIQPFYNRYPTVANFKLQLKEKSAKFSSNQRKILNKQLLKQYGSMPISEGTQKNIEALTSENTFTITTGHQLNLFTGPMYFLYKIITVINLAEELNRTHTKQHFVPIYWMATEDHDFDEINYFNLFGKKLHWNRDSGGAVGDLSTDGLDELLKMFSQEIGEGERALDLVRLFSEAYINHDNLAEATRFLGNTLFADYGLVIIDGNDAELKRAFIPFAEKELIENLSHKKVTESTQKLTGIGYPEQVHPREINLFYLADGLRERIIEREGRYLVNDTDRSFSRAEIIEELHNFPERFSPNALLRPLYQEIILPNLCYVGGGGELAYWFQLKDYFESVKVPFPILILRNSALLISEKNCEKLDKMKVNVESLFLKQHNLLSQHTHHLSEIKIDFSVQRSYLRKQFEELYKVAKQTDASFLGAVGAQEKKQLNGLDALEKRLLKAQQRKNSNQLERLRQIQDTLFPNQSLQERTLNFSEFYLQYGDGLIPELKKNLNPMSNDFSIVSL